MVVQTEWGCEIEVSRHGCSAVVKAECRLQRLKRSADAEGDRRCGINGIVVVTTCEAVLQDAMHSGARRQQTRVRPWLQFATSHAPSPDFACATLQQHREDTCDCTETEKLGVLELKLTLQGRPLMTT